MSTETLSPVEDRPRVNTGAPFAACCARPSRPTSSAATPKPSRSPAGWPREFATNPRCVTVRLPAHRRGRAYSQSGLWGITVPKAYGGAGVSYATLAEVIRILAEGDSSIAQITQNHLALVAHIELDGTEAQKKELFGLVLQGTCFGNAFSEKGSKNVAPSRPSRAKATTRWSTGRSSTPPRAAGAHRAHRRGGRPGLAGWPLPTAPRRA
jgi:hypothetical protein